MLLLAENRQRAFTSIGEDYISVMHPAPPPTNSIRKRSWALGAAVVLTMALATTLSAVVNSTPLAGAQSGAPATGNIRVRDGANPGEVIISWNAVPQATHYRIGYVNMETDYPLAKTSVTGDWINAFIYVDENARNVPVSSGRAEYTVRRLEQNVRHAFTVLTSNSFVDTGGGGSVNSEFSWPSSPRWEFHTVADRGSECPTSCSSSQPPPPSGQLTLPAGATVLVIPPSPNGDCVVGLQLAPGDSCNWPDPTDAGSVKAAVGISNSGDYHGQAIALWDSGNIWVHNPDSNRAIWTTGPDGADATRFRFHMERGAGDTWTIAKVNEPYQRN